MILVQVAPSCFSFTIVITKPTWLVQKLSHICLWSRNFISWVCTAETHKNPFNITLSAKKIHDHYEMNTKTKESFLMQVDIKRVMTHQNESYNRRVVTDTEPFSVLCKCSNLSKLTREMFNAQCSMYVLTGEMFNVQCMYLLGWL